MSLKEGFRYDINGLRAIAVLLVLCFHFKVPFFDGGFAGVDIFYVISGYLMTRIIIGGLEREDFALINFYQKRIQRIIPALTVMVLVVLVTCFFLYLPDDYIEVTKNGSGSLLFVSNIVYAFSGGYFANSADNNVFLHTWSLSVEWQFYLILPIILLVLNKYVKIDRKKYTYIVLACIILIFAGTLVATRYKPNHSFYLLPTRSWEMLAGSLAFLMGSCINERYRSALAIASYLVLLVCAVLIRETMQWPGLFTLIPVAATFMILITNVNTFRLLNSNITMFFGKISYSLYLWHWPVFVIGNYVGVPSTPVNALLGMLLSIGLGYLSYRYIESFDIKKHRVIVASTATLGLVAFFASTTYINAPVFEENSLKIADYEQVYKKEHRLQFGMDSCFVTSGSDGLKGYRKRCLPILEGRKNILLVGDSHAAQFYQSLRDYFAAKNIHLGEVTASSCLPLKSGEAPDPGNCRDMLNYIFQELLPEHAAEIDGIILSGNWAENEHGNEQLLKDIRKTGEYLDKLGIDYVVLGQTETYKIDYSSIAAREYEYGIEVSEAYLDPEPEETNAYLKAGLKNKYIDIFRMKDIEEVSSDYVPYMSDQNHLTLFGANQLLKENVFPHRSFQGIINN